MTSSPSTRKQCAKWTRPSPSPKPGHGNLSRTLPATCTRSPHEDHLSRGLATGAARGAHERPARVPDGRGRRQVRRQLRGVQGLPRRVRTGAHPRHAAVRARLRRRRHRRRAGGNAPDRRSDDRQFQPARARPDREHRRAVSAHVRRTVQHPAGDPDGHRSRPPARRAALAQLRELVRLRPRDQGRRARDDRRRARHAGAGARRSGPGDRVRARAPLQRRRRARRCLAAGGHQVGEGPAAGPRRDDLRVWRNRGQGAGGGEPSSRRMASRPRSSICACCDPSTTRRS